MDAAQIVPIRRCNLDCAYCNEYDKASSPVPLRTMLRRIDLLSNLGTTIITLKHRRNNYFTFEGELYSSIVERGGGG